MLTVKEYFGEWESLAVGEMRANAARLVGAVNRLIEYAEADGVKFLRNPHTGSIVSGEHFGGFRPQSCPIGAPKSAHKQGLAVDLYDPEGEIDDWCMSNQTTLGVCGIYLEHPGSTRGWSHWTIRAPRSGNRVFYP